jgi:hypothetical protein
MTAVTLDSPTAGGETSGENGEEETSRQQLKAEYEERGGSHQLLGLEEIACTRAEP